MAREPRPEKPKSVLNTPKDRQQFTSQKNIKSFFQNWRKIPQRRPQKSPKILKSRGEETLVQVPSKTHCTLLNAPVIKLPHAGPGVRCPHLSSQRYDMVISSVMVKRVSKLLCAPMSSCAVEPSPVTQSCSGCNMQTGISWSLLSNQHRISLARWQKNGHPMACVRVMSEQGLCLSTQFRISAVLLLLTVCRRGWRQAA